MVYILRRLGFYVIAFFVSLTINFFLPRFMKGDAVSSYLARNRNISPEAADSLRILLGIDTDKSMWQQEMPLHREFFDKLGDRLPPVMQERFESLSGKLA